MQCQDGVVSVDITMVVKMKWNALPLKIDSDLSPTNIKSSTTTSQQTCE